MIILYVPFAIREKEDLLEKALEWQQALKIEDSNREVLVLQYGFDENSIPEDERLTVYVLCHGTDYEVAVPTDDPNSQTYYFASCASPEIGTVFLTIEDVVARYESDFCYHKNDITKIKLYFCNNVGTEKEIAHRFDNALVNMDENTRIDYYFGVLSTPLYDYQKNKLKKPSTVSYDDHKEIKYAADTRRSLFRQRNENSYNRRSNDRAFDTKEAKEKHRKEEFKKMEFFASKENRMKKTQEKSKEERHKVNNIRRGIMI